ncbi:lytic transglycosylase domain-containing protein [Caulobacter sp. S45]|uniref:lytic transglycosylase domain-containing protein n=1 Tax=Caulobacter sp. S45 TaxID=1641861 RepID=UPI0020B14221|nr:lytic transglycosylase domain-containing protein [Caulobacter sp. S45]
MTAGVSSPPDRTPQGRMIVRLRVLAAVLLAGVCTGAVAQTSPDVVPGTAPALPYSPVVGATPYVALSSSLSEQDAVTLRSALQAARAGDVTRATALRSGLANPTAQKLVTWAMVDSAGSELDYYTLVSAMRDLEGFPRPARLRAALEKALATTALPPQQVIDLFQGRDPETGQGTIALASAYQSAGRQADAQALIKHAWRNHAFDADSQSAMLGRFGIFLTPDDHAARLEMLLYSPAGPEVHQLLPLVSTDQQALAQARIAFHTERSDASLLFSQLPLTLQNSPDLAFDRAHYFRKHNLEALAAGLVRDFPTATPEQPEVTKEIWKERRALMYAALQSQDYKGAYAAAADAGLQPGQDAAEAQFFAGWIALTKLKNADLAEQHFVKLQAGVTTPISLARGYYWRGRAAEAKGDVVDARLLWSDGAKYGTVFYGQLSAAKIGQTSLNLGVDPVATAADRARFEARGVVKALRMVGDAGDRPLMAAFAMATEEDIDTPAELGLLVDLVRMYGDQSLSMRVVRSAASRGIVLPERGYPVRMAPMGYGLPEPAFIFAITRQESSFDPYAHSGVGARGMMQLMPSTASVVARRAGIDYSPSRLDDADYNMKLGATFLGQLTDEFSGSYVLATAAYNAGPGRPPQWITSCGDPRNGGTDAADFIECIPFSETRDYVMRVMEATQVYRARLHGGSAPLTIATDLKRGGWSATAPTGYTPTPHPVLPGYAGSAGASMAPTTPSAPMDGNLMR